MTKVQPDPVLLIIINVLAMLPGILLPPCPLEPSAFNVYSPEPSGGRHFLTTRHGASHSPCSYSGCVQSEQVGFRSRPDALKWIPPHSSLAVICNGRLPRQTGPGRASTISKSRFERPPPAPVSHSNQALLTVVQQGVRDFESGTWLWALPQVCVFMQDLAGADARPSISIARIITPE
jgi:hypothetical protein